jgi:GNAT superfamily N-acetyltransferase
MAQAPDVVVRPARVGDVAELVAMISALAEYERAADEVEVTVAQLSGALFGPAPVIFAHVAEHAGAVVGMAIWFVNFSTWTGHHGIYLEDLFVRPPARDLGAGRALLGALAAIAVERGYTRVEWSVLDWNDPAIGFYRHLGARPQEDWTVFRLAGPELDRLAAE